MQPLPSAIHLGQLKNQAKDLRDACRAGQPEALSRLRHHHPQHAADSRREVSLQEAQLVIAREQGFDSWPKLAVAAGQRAVPLSIETAFVGDSVAARNVRHLLASAAAATTPVLLIGAAGTGKRLCAQLIHAAGPRAANRFARVACGGNPTLVDSELFGHEPDAFTGARAAHAGLLQTSDGGSLLVDEIEQLDAQVQIRLQDYLDSGTFRRLGGVSDLASDVRIMAASVRPLQPDLMQRLREDLYYGLSVLAIELPLLQDRAEDVARLAEHFAMLISPQRAPSAGPAPAFTPAALSLLSSQAWPGNVRQLRSVVERAVLTASTGLIDVDDLELHAKPSEA